jgi:SAM-dependent methyltransferase
VVQRLAGHFRSAVGLDLEIAKQPPPGSTWALVQGDSHYLPFKDRTIDVIAMGDVVEHLADPRMVFRECARVLRPRTGRLIVTTVNLYFPPIVLGRLLPHRVRQAVNQLATGTEPENTFPVYYRANTRRGLIESASAAGLKPLSVRFLSQHPEYLMFSILAYRLGIVLERAVRRCEALRGLRHYIHGVFAPIEDAAECRA